MAQDSAVQADEPSHIKKHYKKLKHMKSLGQKESNYFSLSWASWERGQYQWHVDAIHIWYQIVF